MLRPVGLSHVNAIRAARSQINFGQRHGEVAGRVPGFQLFFFRPRVEHALPRRADGAVELEGRRRLGLSGHGVSGGDWDSR